jgi:hypothetical protein
LKTDLLSFLFGESQERERLDSSVQHLFEAAAAAERITMTATPLAKALKAIKYKLPHEEFDQGDGSIDLVYDDQAAYDSAWILVMDSIDQLASLGWVPANCGQLDHSAEDSAKFCIRMLDVGSSEIDTSELDGAEKSIDDLISNAADQTFSGQPIKEAYKGQDIVQWQGRIERQLTGFIADAERDSNFGYGDKLREFLRVWRDNAYTGSINIETTEVLLAATDMLAVDTWRLASYFGSLRDQLRRLKASTEELPSMPDEAEYQSMRDAVRDVAPVATFGKQEKKPRDSSAPAATALAADYASTLPADDLGVGNPDEGQP